jgi:hypothetical protein
MNSDFDGGGAGCLSLPGLALAAMFLVFLLALAGGDDTSTNTANAEVLSRNQVNLWSDVTNEYYNCLAAGSCVTSVETTSTTNTSNVSVEGERNTIMLSDGRTACEDPNFPGQYAPEYCSGNWGQP